MKKSTLIFLGLMSFAYANELYYYSGGKKVLLGETKETRANAKPGYKYYTTDKGRSVGVSDKLIAKFKDGVDISKTLSEYNLTIVETMKNGMYLLKATDAISSSNALVEGDLVVFAHPDFLIKKDLRTLDPLYSQAWHLENTGQSGGVKGADINVLPAWKTTKGKGIKIAIFDDAVDVNHEDLKDALVAQYDFDDDIVSAMPTANDQEHGTAVAGLALARENSVGSVGVAPESSMIAIKQFNDTVSTTVKAFNWAKTQGADVVNCSWGTGDAADAEIAAINDLTTNGRNGKGTVVVFAVPNDSGNNIGNDESAIPSVLSVGASDNTNLRAYYSSYGVALKVMAPSGGGTLDLCSTDITGNMGYATIASGHPNYIYATDKTGFAGTSGSAPIAAGVAALVLAANPSLTSAQVIDILESTADKIGTKAYSNGRNLYYGYGKINAGAAVAKALSTAGGQSTGGTASTGTPNPPAPPINSYSLVIYSGWNLVSVPFNGSVSYADIVDGSTVVRGYSYINSSNSYVTPSLFTAGNGYWLYASSPKTASFAPYQTYLGSFDAQGMVSQAKSGWNLLGVPVDAQTSTLLSAGAATIWAYVNSSGGYAAPVTLTSGTGFWLRK